MSQTLRLLRHAAVFGFAELRAIYTWRTWTGGWLVRIVAQVTFFGLIGHLLDSPERTRFVVLGNIVVIAGVEACFLIASMCAERATGTLPLVVSTPGSHVPVFLGRGAHWLLTGTASATVALLTVPRLLGVEISPMSTLLVIAMLPVIGLSAYCYAYLLGNLALLAMRWQWLFLNLGYLLLMVLCGVNVPVAYWPQPLAALANILPVTHGLMAIRETVSGGTAGHILSELALEVGVGAAWLVLGVAVSRRFVSTGRRDGSIELS